MSKSSIGQAMQNKDYLTPGVWSQREGISRQRAFAFIRENRIPGIASITDLVGGVRHYIPASVRLDDIIPIEKKKHRRNHGN